MAWLARSIADSLRLDDVDEAEYQDEDEQEGDVDDHRGGAVPNTSASHHNDAADRDRRQNHQEPESSEEAQARGVKEDLTELTESLTRQLWGVANLLAPPPPSSSGPSRLKSTEDAWDQEGQSESGEEKEQSIGSCGADDRAEIGERVECGSVEGIEYEEEERKEVVGVKEEVLNFARNIAMHPETWLDFPLDPEEDLDDFEMSGAQQEHALAIEGLAPRLRALRIELCPCHMSDSYFWKVYFVLLHSRLDKHDAEILSTPQVMEARALWMQELHQQTKEDSDWLGKTIYHMKTGLEAVRENFPGSPSYTLSSGMPFRSFDFETAKSSTSRYSDSERCPSLSSETQVTGESAVEENSAVETKDSDPPPVSFSKILQKFEEEEDDVWPEDDDSDLVGYNIGIIPVGIEDDVSFSDLEDDGDVSMPIKPKPLLDNQQRKCS